MAYIVLSPASPHLAVTCFDSSAISRLIGTPFGSVPLWILTTQLKSNQVACIKDLYILLEITDHAAEALIRSIDASNEGEF